MFGSSKYLLAALATSLCGGFATAADLPREGTYDVTACFTQNITRIRHSDNHIAWSYEEKATVTSTPPGGLFDGDAVRCVASGAMLAGKTTGLSFCEGVGTDGSRRLTRYWYDADGKVQREEVAGTGRYEGLVTTGTVQRVGALEEKTPGVRTYCNRLTGTYRLK